MKITKDQVEHVAHLARLSLTEEEKVQMTKDMEMILEFADQINEYTFEDVNATAHVIPINNVFRDDEVSPSMNRDVLLSNAPSKENGCYTVPKVVE
jgi:aspartyl-tRNA(Asn)/glutamyl-tRNA(Gln) amidotransferase subunit C